LLELFDTSASWLSTEQLTKGQYKEREIGHRHQAPTPTGELKIDKLNRLTPIFWPESATLAALASLTIYHCDVQIKMTFCRH
jgi:hypothetical protein